jgi:L-alanine-DL-glutamate epimerase-like enolase superfamily enzyme
MAGMKAMLTIVPVQQAYDDLLQRTLAKVPCDLARLIYLASMRDYNTGKYHHDGLAASFSPAVAMAALEMAHRDIFHKVAGLPLIELAKQMITYLKSSHEDPAEVLRAWRRLEPYRVAIPMNVNATVASLFISNVKLALVILPRLPLPDRSHPSVA